MTTHPPLVEAIRVQGFMSSGDGGTSLNYKNLFRDDMSLIKSDQNIYIPALFLRIIEYFLYYDSKIPVW